MPAIEEFLWANPGWTESARLTRNDDLTILSRHGVYLGGLAPLDHTTEGKEPYGVARLPDNFVAGRSPPAITGPIFLVPWTACSEVTTRPECQSRWSWQMTPRRTIPMRILAHDRQRYPKNLEVVLIRMPEGIGAAKNAALDRCRGRTVAILDFDDEFLPDKLMRCHAVLEAAASTSSQPITTTGCPTVR